MVEVTFREYLKASKDAMLNGLKVFGVIFSVIAVILLILTEWGNINSITEIAKYFVFCVLFGNGLGLLLVFIGVAGEYARFKSTIRFFNSIPESIKKRYELIMGNARGSKYDFPKLEIINYTPNSPIVQFRKLDKEVHIILYICFGDKVNSHREKLDFDQKYKEQHISLTGWGLMKTIDVKEWNVINESVVNVYLRELHEVANNEKMNIIKWGDAQEVNNL